VGVVKSKKALDKNGNCVLQALDDTLWDNEGVWTRHMERFMTLDEFYENLKDFSEKGRVYIKVCNIKEIENSKMLQTVLTAEVELFNKLTPSPLD